MTRLIDGAFSKGFETIRLLITNGEFTEELAEKIRECGGVKRALNAMRQEFFPVAPPPPPAKPKRWIDMGDYIILPVVADREWTGEEWNKSLHVITGDSSLVSNHTRILLTTREFSRTPKGVYLIAVLKYSSFESGPNVRQAAAKGMNMGFFIPNSDIACFLRDQYSASEFEEMGLRWIAVMHKPIASNANDLLNFFTAHARYSSAVTLATYDDNMVSWWGTRGGFAFLLSPMPHKD